ncbi:sel1 repeat family protein [Ochrobactrum pseudogrignonense]|nr:sel1 repeat family protein [Brucella pseudogrignonensis]
MGGLCLQGRRSRLSPYACKLIGNIYALGLGTAVNAQQAAMAYQSGCFHPFVATTDGEACIRYGNLLLGAKPPIVLAGDAYAGDQTAASLITEASRAYDMGCMDNIEQACQLNRTLLEDWSRGRYPHDRTTCSVKDDAGTTRSEKPAAGFPSIRRQPNANQDVVSFVSTSMSGLMAIKP